MKIPRSVIIKGERWKVTMKKVVKDDDGNLVHGLCDYSTKTILIERGLKPEIEDLVFLHELIHAGMHELHIDLGFSRNETLTDGLSSILHKLLRFEVRKYSPKRDP